MVRALLKPARFLTASARRVRVKRIQIDEIGGNPRVGSSHDPGRENDTLMASMVKI